jgi:phage-related protein
MAHTTFHPPVPPSPGTSDKAVIKKLVAEFGDGYSQAVPDGINSLRREISLDWNLLTPEQAGEIIMFFRARGGCEPFFWTPSDETTALKWICDDWKEKRGEGGFRSISATFKQSFLL